MDPICFSPEQRWKHQINICVLIVLYGDNLLGIAKPQVVRFPYQQGTAKNLHHSQGVGAEYG